MFEICFMLITASVTGILVCAAAIVVYITYALYKWVRKINLENKEYKKRQELFKVRIGE